jgi:hypothetical protein
VPVERKKPDPADSRDNPIAIAEYLTEAFLENELDAVL